MERGQYPHPRCCPKWGPGVLSARGKCPKWHLRAWAAALILFFSFGDESFGSVNGQRIAALAVDTQYKTAGPS